MKAFLLAAGVGSRLRPITDTIPKCMVPVDSQPMLDIWLDAFDQAGVDEVLVTCTTCRTWCVTISANEPGRRACVLSSSRNCSAAPAP